MDPRPRWWDTVLVFAVLSSILGAGLCAPYYLRAWDVAAQELLPAPAPALPEGYYEFSGTIDTPRPGTYRGLVLLTEHTKGYSIVWVHDDGESVSGYAMLHEGKLIVSGASGPGRTVAIYTITPGKQPTLTGTWLGNGGKSGTETLKLLKKFPKDL